jgi:hypothetical protein
MRFGYNGSHGRMHVTGTMMPSKPNGAEGLEAQPCSSQYSNHQPALVTHDAVTALVLVTSASTHVFNGGDYIESVWPVSAIVRTASWFSISADAAALTDSTRDTYRGRGDLNPGLNIWLASCPASRW